MILATLGVLGLVWLLSACQPAPSPTPVATRTPLPTFTTVVQSIQPLSRYPTYCHSHHGASHPDACTTYSNLCATHSRLQCRLRLPRYRNGYTWTHAHAAYPVPSLCT